MPFDRFVRAIVTAKGPNFTNPPASFYRRVRTPEDAAEAVSQVFLGVRLGCAKCHNHVAERWTQDDYYGMAAFFSQVRYKNGPQDYRPVQQGRDRLPGRRVPRSASPAPGPS